MFRDLQNNRWIPKGRKIQFDITDQACCCIRAFQHCRRLWTQDSSRIYQVFIYFLWLELENWKRRCCYPEIQVTLTVLYEGIKDEIYDLERMLKALIKSLENKSLNPWILDHFLPTGWEKNQKWLMKAPFRVVLLMDALGETTSHATNWDFEIIGNKLKRKVKWLVLWL